MGLSEGKDKEVKNKIGLSDYKKLLDQADAEITDTQARYEKYAEAQAWLTDSSLFLPAMSSTGAAPVISRVVPFSASYTQSGDKAADVYFKYLKLQANTVTTKEYKEAREKWLKEKAESNEKAQKELASHVK